MAQCPCHGTCERTATVQHGNGVRFVRAKAMSGLLLVAAWGFFALGLVCVLVLPALTQSIAFIVYGALAGLLGVGALVLRELRSAPATAGRPADARATASIAGDGPGHGR